ncbi:hypothetical protein INT45_003022 [Circinella minor]|uniref:Uncharacterized protein n=1 Tax=Circinella minor TaxID=1195481 RepID=A0A8H7RPI5_9FUNG|nr:hypothetical protein INT45_003022 [Circinella minor]
MGDYAKPPMVITTPTNDSVLLTKNPTWTLLAWNLGVKPSSQPCGAALNIINKSKTVNLSTRIRQAAYEQWCELTDLNYMKPNQSNQIRNNNHFKEFQKGLCQDTLLSQKSYNYDVQPALDYIISLGDSHHIEIDILTAKLSWLLAMVGFLRPSDLERIDLNQCSISSDDILSLVVVAPKEKQSGMRITKAIAIHPHSSYLVCPVTTYKAYCSYVASILVSVLQPVFPQVSLVPLLRYVNDHNQDLSSQHIGKYINQVMKFVGRPPWGTSAQGTSSACYARSASRCIS